MYLSELKHGFLRAVTWICQNWYMDFCKLLHGFVKIDTWIFLSCFVDLSQSLPGFVKLLHGFVKFFPALCQTKPSSSLTKISKLLEKFLLWNKVVERVKVFNALGPLCLWQCFICQSMPLSEYVWCGRGHYGRGVLWLRNRETLSLWGHMWLPGSFP